MHREDPLPGSTVLVVGPPDAGFTEITAALEAAGLFLETGHSAAEALRLTRRLPDLVVVGGRLPDMDDVDLITALKEDPLTFQIPVLQHSSPGAGDDARVEGLSSGADAHLVRPIRSDVLVATVRSLLRQRELSRQLELALSLDVTGVYDWAIPTDAVRWTPSLERMYRMEPGTFGGTIADFVAALHPDDRERIGTELAAALENDDTIDMSFRFVRADGSVGWMESRGRIFRNRDGEAVRLLGLAHDVSTRVYERGRVEQLRRLAAALATARTSGAVIDLLHTELDGTNADVAFVSTEEPAPHDTVFSHLAGEQRLDIRHRPTPDGGVTVDQARTIGGLAAGALDRALTYEAERSNAVALQRALLPGELPRIDGWRIDARYDPAGSDERLGGDFYDVVDLGERFVVLLGDVAGHGLGATTQMGTIRILLRTSAAAQEGRPLETLGHARALFDDVCGVGAPFATAILLAVERRSGLVQVVSAGHPAPIMVGSGRPRRLEVTPGPPLGVAASAAEELLEFVLPAQSSLIAYTDGVIETRTQEEPDVEALMGELGPFPTAGDVIAVGHSLDELNPDDRAALVISRL